MGITDETYLPTDEELTVPEVNVSGPVLKAAAHHLGNACLKENNVCEVNYLISELILREDRYCRNLCYVDMN